MVLHLLSSYDQIAQRYLAVFKNEIVNLLFDILWLIVYWHLCSTNKCIHQM